MTKQQYRVARSLIRANGRYALRWLQPLDRLEMDHLLNNVQDTEDPLAERASIIAYCRRLSLPCTVRHTMPVRRPRFA